MSHITTCLRSVPSVGGGECGWGVEQPPFLVNFCVRRVPLYLVKSSLVARTVVGLFSYRKRYYLSDFDVGSVTLCVSSEYFL